MPEASKHPSRLRVLFIARKWPPAIGGMEVYAHSLAEALATKVHLHSLVLPGRADGSPPSTISLAAFLLRCALFLWKYRRWNVVHFGDLVLYPLARLHRWLHPGTARIVTVYGLDLLYANRSGPAPWLYRRLMSSLRHNQGCLDHFLCISRHTASLCEEAGLGPCSVVPLGAPSPRPPSYLSIVSPKRILFVGRLVRRKGCRWFAEQVLPALARDVRLQVVGKAWDSEEIAALEAHPRVEVLGCLSDEALELRYAEASLIVVPNIPSSDATDAEGFGLVALAAAARGIPCLVADLEGLSDAVIDGVTGFLLPPLGVEAWRGKIEQILAWTEAERKLAGSTAIAATYAHYSWETVAQRTTSIYKASIESRPGVA